MKIGKSQPKAPDPAATAAAQASANKETAIAQSNINMVDQYTPYGNLTYSQIGTASDGTPRYKATQTLSPDEQTKLNLNNQAQIKYGNIANNQLQSVGSALSQPLNYSSLGAAPTVNEQTRQSVADAMYQRMAPQYQQDEEALRTRLANQGITDPNSAAYRAEMDAYNRRLNDARLAIQGQAGNEMRADYSTAMAGRNQAINEMLQQRQTPLNETIAMLTGAQVNQPSYVNTPQTQVQGTDVTTPVYANYQAQMGASSANTQGMYGLLGAGLGAGAYMWGR